VCAEEIDGKLERERERGVREMEERRGEEERRKEKERGGRERWRKRVREEVKRREGRKQKERGREGNRRREEEKRTISSKNVPHTRQPFPPLRPNRSPPRFSQHSFRADDEE
jgi:hypothetical protein